MSNYTTEAEFMDAMLPNIDKITRLARKYEMEQSDYEKLVEYVLNLMKLNLTDRRRGIFEKAMSEYIGILYIDNNK